MSQESGGSTAQQRYSIAQIHFLVYAATNKLVGHDQKISSKMLFEYLREPVCAILEEASYRSLNQIADDRQAWKSMAETIFRSAIELGDCTTAAKLLAWPQLGIDVNGLRNKSRQGYLTPMQRSSQLKHFEMVELLLCYGADVNSISEQQLNDYSTLDYALQMNRDDPLSYNQRLVDLLLRFGARLGSLDSFSYEIERANIDVIRSLAIAFLPGEKRRWISGGIFHIILDSLSEQDVICVLEIANLTALDANIKPDRESSALVHMRVTHEYAYDRDTPGLITVAAERGHLLVVSHLLKAGIAPTQCTLIGAIRSRSIDTCKLLLNHGVDRHSFSDQFHTTPIAEAVRSEESEILDMLCPVSFLEKVIDSPSSCAILQALVELGDARTLEQFLHTDSVELLKPSCYTVAICQATERDSTELANILLERLFKVKSKFRWHSRECACRHSISTRVLKDNGCYVDDPLLIALRKQNDTLIRDFIDALDDGSITLPWMREEQSEVTLAAATQGNAMVLEWLHHQGFPLDGSLAATVRFGNLGCMRLLLNLGAASEPLTPTNGTALQEAIKRNDMVAFRELLEHGQDPKDSRAATLAVKLSSPLFEPLLDAVEQSILPFQTRPLNLHFALTALASAIVWDKKIYTRRFLELGVRIDICKVHFHGEIGPGSKRHSWTSSDALYCFDHHSNSYDECNLPAVSWLFAEKTEDYIGPSQSKGKYSPLGLAVMKDRGRDRSMVQLLLEAGMKYAADVDGIAFLPSSDFGRKSTALLLAVETGESEMVQLLLNYGANVNAPAEGGIKRTPLQKAAELGSWSLVHLLLISNHADVNAPPASRAGATALQLAAIGGYTGIAELLIEHNADVLAAGAKVDGRTALEGAAEHGCFDMVQFLIRQVRHPDTQYTSAIDFAMQNGHRAVANMLRSLLMEQQASTRRLQSVQQHTCGECGKSFTREYTLNRHVAAVHGGIQQEQKFKCSFCPRTFPRRDTLKRHRETHTEAAHVACPKCSKVFSRSDYLAVHLKKCQQSENAT